MSEYKKTDTSLSSKIYLLLLILYITTLFFPIVTDYELTGWDWPLINLTAFIIGGYHGMTLLFISFFYISKFRFIRFLICSIFGSLAIGINYIFLYFIYSCLIVY